MIWGHIHVIPVLRMLQKGFCQHGNWFGQKIFKHSGSKKICVARVKQQLYLLRQLKAEQAKRISLSL